MKTFSLKVLASDRVFFDGRCKMVILPAADGQLGVLANHGDMVVALKMGEMRIQKEDETWETALIGKGVMQDINNRMTILTEFAEHPDEIDEKGLWMRKRGQKSSCARNRVSRNIIILRQPCPELSPD